jgi:hypothetical protein
MVVRLFVFLHCILRKLHNLAEQTPITPQAERAG